MLISSFFIKIPHFFRRKGLTNLKKFAAKPIEYILFHRLEAIFMLPVNNGGHFAYQNFVILLTFNTPGFLQPESL